MPNQKSPLIFLACGIAALFLLLVGLRHEASKPLQEPVEAQSADEVDSDSGSPGTTRITHIAKVEAPPVAKNRKPPPEFLAEKKEDFDAEQRRAVGDSNITGSVRNEKNKGLAGARVQLYNNDPNTTNPPLRESVADQDGSFTLAQLNDGDRNYILVSRAEGYAPEARYVTLSGAPVELSVNLVPAVTLTGKVINAVTSEPLAGATIIHPSETDEVFGLLGSITSGPGGTFTFEDSHPGRVLTRVSTPGYRTATVRLRAPTTTATVMLVPGGSTIRGFTVDRLTSKPQSGARVWIDTENTAAIGPRFRDSKMVNDDGSFEFTDLPGSTYRIYAVRGMKSPSQEIELKDNQVKEGVEITLPADLFVSGKVVDANENKALPGVRIWYKSPRGRSSVLSDNTGLFAFDTMAIDKYTIQVHEKGYLPVQEKKTTGVVETLTRPVPRNASSDSFVLRMRPVPAINGNVVATRKPDAPPTPVFNADVSVDYLMGQDHEKITTKTDPNGDFFINLPERRRGEAKIVAFKNNAIDALTQKIPTRKTVKLNLKRNMAFGTLLLSDKSPLDGIRMEIAQFLPDNKENALILHERDIYTGIGGRFWFPLPEKQKVQLTFFLPDNVQIPKTYQTDNIINKRVNFIYDPVSNDVLLDTGGQGRGGRDQRGQGARGTGGQGNQAGQGQRGTPGQNANGGGRQPGNPQAGAGHAGNRAQ